MKIQYAKTYEMQWKMLTGKFIVVKPILKKKEALKSIM